MHTYFSHLADVTHNLLLANRFHRNEGNKFPLRASPSI